MFLRPASLLAGSGLVLLLAACGGGKSGSADARPTPAAPALPAAEAQALAETFLQAEGNPSLIAPYLNPASEVPIGLMPPGPAIPACVQATVERPSATSVKVTLVLSGCERNGATASGRVVLLASSTPPSALVSFEPLSAAAGTKSWVLDGAKGFTRNTTTQELRIQTNNFKVAFADTANPASNRAFTYNSDLTGSFEVAGEYRVWGTFSLAVAGGDTVTGSISRETPLVYTQACCHPTAGTLEIAKNGASAQATFQATCGSVTITPKGGQPEYRTLPVCK